MTDRATICAEIAAIFQKHGCTPEEALDVLKLRAPSYLFRNIKLDQVNLDES